MKVFSSLGREEENGGDGVNNVGCVNKERRGVMEMAFGPAHLDFQFEFLKPDQ